MLDGKEMADLLGDFVNPMHHDSQGFVEGIMRQHRTLQQETFKLMWKCIEKWSEIYELGHYDERNGDTCRLCNEIYKAHKDSIYLPYI